MQPSASPHRTAGLVLHSAWWYDVVAWLFLGGRERAFRERLAQLARLRPGEHALDVGCGTGSLAIEARRRVGSGGEVFGVDPSPEMIARAGKKAASAGLSIDFAIGTAEALPFRDRRFDVVLSTLMLHHLPRETREACVREIRRVLRPGGRVLAVDFGRSASSKRGLLAHIHRGHGGVPLDEIIALLGDAGLQLLESGGVGIRELNFALARAPVGA